MLNLDFSIRPESEWTTTITPSTEDVLMMSLFEEAPPPAIVEVGSKRSSDQGSSSSSSSRPSTPEHVKRMRATIDAEAGESDTASVYTGRDVHTVSAAPAPPRDNPFKGAGALREYGGIKGYMSKAEGKKRAAVQD